VCVCVCVCVCMRVCAGACLYRIVNHVGNLEQRILDKHVAVALAVLDGRIGLG
jgi:hypothetical protein